VTPEEKRYAIVSAIILGVSSLIFGYYSWWYLDIAVEQPIMRNTIAFGFICATVFFAGFISILMDLRKEVSPTP